MSKFKVGDEVMIAESSRWHRHEDPYNPIGVVGKVMSELPCPPGSYIWKVEWSEGVINQYRDEDLVLSSELGKGEPLKVHEYVGLTGSNLEESAPAEQALRYNEGKPQLSYILDANYAIEGICKVMEFGATKYERNNWKKGFPKEKLADSLLRHLTKFLNGEELDEESGLPHVDHIGCNALFLAQHFNGRKPTSE